MNVDVAMTYLDFVAERHRVWEARQAGQPGPWTEDPILRSKKFTNVFRVLDPGSQFVLTDLAEPGLDPIDVLARCFLYRHTNLPSAWTYILGAMGRYPLAMDMGDDLVGCWQQYRANGGKLFSGAYMIYPQSHEPGTDKIEQVVGLTSRLVRSVFPAFLAAASQAERFGVLREVHGVADFMSMQILTDYGYSSQSGQDLEDPFVVLGPGARRGAKAIAPDAPPLETLLWAVDAVREMPDCPTLKLEDGRLRKPSYMDIQNTLCEFSKYDRYLKQLGPPIIERKPYRPAHPGVQDQPVTPGHW